MTYIKVNLTNANEYIEKYKTYKSSCYDTILTSCALLENSDSCWNDQASIEFREIVKDDRLKILDYFANLDLLVKEIENFNKDLIFCLTNVGYSSQQKLSLKFDDSRVDKIKVYLDNANSYLNNAVYIINYYILNSNYENKGSFYTIKSKINGLIYTISTIKSNIVKFDTSVSNAVSLYNEKVNKINGLDLDVKNIGYTGNVIDMS